MRAQFTEKDEYISKIAKTDDEFAELIDLGFEYVDSTPFGTLPSENESRRACPMVRGVGFEPTED